MNGYRIFAALMLISALTGCGTMGTKSGTGSEAATVEEHGTAATTDQGAQSQALGALGKIQGYAVDDPNAPASVRTIYFAFDSSEVTPEGQELITAHANYLAAHPQLSVVLEGHADERGSREYNIGLGDRRAQAVRRLMELQGVNSQQITTVSYGEEKPAVEGHNEAAWSKNRRVEIVYKGQE